MLTLEGAYLKGRKALDDRNFDLAEKYFAQALDVAYFPDAKHDLGIVYIHQKRYNQAELVFKRLNSEEPREAIYWYQLAGVLYEKKSLPQALKAFKKAEQLCPNDEHDLRASIHKMINEIEGMQEEGLEGPYALDERSQEEQEKRYYEAIALQNEGKYEEALELYEEFLELEPTFYRALGNAAVCLLALGQIDKAEKLLLQALQINPDYKHAQSNLEVLREMRAKGMNKPLDVVQINDDEEKSYEEQRAEQIEKLKEQSSGQASLWRRILSSLGL
jgi:tetratricopeptide (TPR) repeat protein